MGAPGAGVDEVEVDGVEGAVELEPADEVDEVVVPVELEPVESSAATGLAVDTCNASPKVRTAMLRTTITPISPMGTLPR